MNPVKGGLIDNDGSKVAIFPPKPGMENHDGKGSIGHQAAIDSAEHEMKDASAYPTKNNIPEKVRVQIAGLLDTVRTTTIDVPRVPARKRGAQ